MINNHVKLIQALIDGDIGLDQVKEDITIALSDQVGIDKEVELGVAELLEIVNSSDGFIRSSKSIKDQAIDMNQYEYFYQLAKTYNELY